MDPLPRELTHVAGKSVVALAGNLSSSPVRMGMLKSDRIQLVHTICMYQVHTLDIINIC